MEKVLPAPSTQLARLLFPRGPSPATSAETAAKCICCRSRKSVQPGRAGYLDDILRTLLLSSSVLGSPLASGQEVGERGLAGTPAGGRLPPSMTPWNAPSATGCSTQSERLHPAQVTVMLTLYIIIGNQSAAALLNIPCHCGGVFLRGFTPSGCSNVAKRTILSAKWTTQLQPAGGGEAVQPARPRA